MQDVIKLLPDHVANQIAAGEVVQRPASVVKELLENAIDAGATDIKLVAKDAGKTLIQVIDDGKGMSMTDARMAFERHATSKISKAEDLFNLHTKGFRGEALASIAAISHVVVKSKQSGNDLGTELRIEGSKVISQEPAVTPKGTTISVANLFYNIPARRKFLKSDNVELRNITDEFHRVALAHPDVSLSFIHNGTDLFNLPRGSYRQRIVNIMGSKTNEKLIAVEEETEIVTISGYIGKPEFARKTKGLQYFFVNDRFIRHNYLHHAVSAAFEGLLKDGANPSYFLYLDVPHDSVDINIHPTKTEVKFDDEHSLYAIIRASVKHALGQFQVSAIDFEKETEYDLPYQVAKGKPIKAPRIEVDRNFNPFVESGPSDRGRSADIETFNDGGKPNKDHFRNSNWKKTNAAPWEALYAATDEPTELIEEKTSTHQSLFSTDETPNSNIFQLQRKYIVSTLQSGLLVVYQQRAHERILFEQLSKQLRLQNSVSQQLLFPIKLNRSKSEVTILRNLRSDLEQIGFQFKELEDNVIEIEGLPLELKEKDVTAVLDAIISTQETELPDEVFSKQDHLAKAMAHSMSIKSGELMQIQEMDHMINQLFSCEESAVTPSGKKVFIKITGDNLQSKFN
ncbi:MAG: DNA mismatch repair endonuclease MutL [Nonlabens sp.]